MVLRMARVSYVDLRGFIDEVGRLGALRRIDGADPYLEVGGITEVAAGLPDCPALLFDRMKGFSSGFRIFTNATTNLQRACLALGIDSTPIGSAQGMDGDTQWPSASHAGGSRSCGLLGKF